MTPLHHIGDFIRGLLVAIPLPVAKGLFLLFFLAIMFWVARLPRERCQAPEGSASGPGSNLKLWALVALALQVLLYLLF